jgi:hypothetical protein
MGWRWVQVGALGVGLLGCGSISEVGPAADELPQQPGPTPDAAAPTASTAPAPPPGTEGDDGAKGGDKDGQGKDPQSKDPQAKGPKS